MDKMNIDCIWRNVLQIRINRKTKILVSFIFWIKQILVALHFIQITLYKKKGHKNLRQTI